MQVIESVVLFTIADLPGRNARGSAEEKSAYNQHKFFAEMFFADELTLYELLKNPNKVLTFLVSAFVKRHSILLFQLHRVFLMHR
jgi:hypothetical protein